MLTVIDLPTEFKPLMILRDVEDVLTGPSLEVLALCKVAAARDDPRLVEESVQLAQDLWVKRGDPLGHTIALLWLAEWYRTKGEINHALRCCERALEHLGAPAALPSITIAQAASHYIRGLSQHMSGDLLEATNSYLTTSQLLHAAQTYWRRIGATQQVESYGNILEWTDRLLQFTAALQSSPPTQPAPRQVLIRLWRSSTEERQYVLVELALQRTVSTQDIIPTRTLAFLLQRSQVYDLVEGVQPVIGYVVAPNIRILQETRMVETFTLHALNPDARLDNDIVLPAGKVRYLFQIADELAVPTVGIHQGRYLLACSTTKLERGSLALFRHRDEGGPVLGTFERDQAGRTHLKEVLKPARFIGESEATFDFLGSVDFTLGLAEPTKPHDLC